MSNKILVTYATLSGSTIEVAEAIRDELSQNGTPVDLHPLADVADIHTYQAVIVGAPMILGWHKEAVKFVEQHQAALQQVPVAYFFTSLHLTKPAENNVNGIPIYCDPALVKAPKNPNKLSFPEKQGAPASCLASALAKAPQVKPVSAGFFGGKLDYSQLALLPKLFVKIIIRGEEGDYRNWEAIRAWATDLRPTLLNV
jgi:menaquinone-dependent protoporphyrinogen oxidase